MKIKRNINLLAVLLLICLFFGSLYVSNNFIIVTNYGVLKKDIQNYFRIIQITDLHNSQFGNSNESLIKKVAAEHPDLILLTGDLLNSDEQDTSIALELISELSKIAPTYASYGNHEKEYEDNYGINLTTVFEEAGAKVLEFSYEDIEVNGQKLRIGGLYGYCTPAKYLKTGEANPKECEFLADFQSTDNPTLLLTHMPYSWIANDAISKWDIDCVFAGHDHGGQIRIPLLGGLYAPDQGWLPGKDCGLYYSKDGEKIMILSRGLGSAGKIPRFNNIPEIVVVDIIPKDNK